MKLKSIKNYSAFLAASVLSFSLMPAMVLVPAEVQAQMLEEVVVTAQRREQSLQDVPISIQTISGDEMTRQGFRTLTDMSTFAPGLVIKNEEEEQGLILRGAGTQGKSFGLEAGVPAFIDGIHFGRASTLKNAFLDVQQVEVLRGPQPVFFGQNASAGALNIRSRRPGNEWQGKAVAEYGNFGRQSIEGAIGGPVTDTLGFRVAGKFDRLEGWLEDWFTGEKFPQQQFEMLRGTVQWTPTDQFQATAKFETTTQDNGPRAAVLVRNARQSNFQTAGHTDIFRTGHPAVSALPFDGEPGEVGKIGIKRGPLFLRPTGYGMANTRVTGDVFDLTQCTQDMLDPGTDAPYPTPQRFLDCEFAESSASSPWHSVLDMTYAFENGIELQSLTGFSRQVFDTMRQAGGPINSNARYRAEDYNQWSTELRLTSPVGETFDWMMGLYYQNNELDVVSETWRADGADAIRALRTNEDAEWYSGFATVTFNFLQDNRASLDVGARYTKIDKRGGGHNFVAEWILADPISGAPTRLPYGQRANVFFGPTWGNAVVVGRGPYLSFSPGADTNPDRVDKRVVSTFEDTSFDPQVVLRYRPTDTLSLYAKYATAYKGGGFDMSVSEIQADPDAFTYGSESVETYEAGARGTFLDGRAQADLTLFWTEFSGLQVEFLDRERDLNVTQNVAAQRSRGIELNGKLLVNDRLTVSGALAFLNARLTKFPNSLCTQTEILVGLCLNQAGVPVTSGGTIDRTGQPARNAPDWQGFVKMDYDLYVSDMYKVNLDGTFTFSDEFITDRAFDTTSMMDKEVDLNLSLSVDIGTQWNVTFWGRNLFGSFRETYYLDRQRVVGSGFATTETQAPVNGYTTYGLQIGYEFF